MITGTLISVIHQIKQSLLPYMYFETDLKTIDKHGHKEY